jgi:segregation and condensation protein B
LADASLETEGEAEPEAPRDETSFRSLLAELDTMEQGLKIDFDDLLLDEPDKESELEDEPADDEEPR